MSDKYDDILVCHYCGVIRHKRLSHESRAAQFAPFAALSGHDEAIGETARHTISRVEMSDDDAAVLSRRMSVVMRHLAEHPQISVIHFVKDRKKSGGCYSTTSGRVKRIEEIERMMYFADGSAVRLDDIIAVDGEVFDGMEEPYFDGI